MPRIFGKNIKTWKLILWIFLVAVLVGVGFFVYQIFIYYQAIRTGELIPLLDQKIASSFSAAVANAHVTPADLERLASSETASLGKKSAKLTIVEFIDFDCPYCKASFMSVRSTVQKYPDQVRLVIRDFPIEELHPRAIAAALAARCAAAQNRFWPYHDLLFANQDKHEDANLLQYAQDAGLDAAKFNVCYEGKRFATDIQKDLADGLQAGIQGTPTFFFNGIRVQGGLTAEMLDYLIKHFLKL